MEDFWDVLVPPASTEWCRVKGHLHSPHYNPSEEQKGHSGDQLPIHFSANHIQGQACHVEVKGQISITMAEADWDEVTYLKKRPQRAADARSQKVSSAVCLG